MAIIIEDMYLSLIIKQKEQPLFWDCKDIPLKII